MRSLSAQTPSPSTSRPGQIAQPRQPATTSSTSKAANTDPNKGTGIIRGRILLANGRPAKRASIQLASRGARATAADDDGKYEFTELPADTYRLSAGKPGFVVVEYGQQRAYERGKDIVLADGQVAEKIDIVLPPSGAISGRIVDENGDPVEGVVVHLLQLQYAGGRRQFVDVGATSARMTDDTGAYRIYGVPPGQYSVLAAVPDSFVLTTAATNAQTFLPAADLPGYAPTYFPGTTAPAEARTIGVGLSQEVSTIDFTLMPAPTVRISGVSLDSRGQPMGALMSRSQRSGGFAERPLRAAPDANGGFHFDHVAPGEYVLQTFGQRRGNEVETDFAYQFVSVAGDNISDLQLQGTPGSTLAGRVIFDGLTEGVRTSGVRLGTLPSDLDRAPMLAADRATTAVGNDGRFTMTGLHGPRRIRIVQPAPGWMLKSVRVNGFDVTDEVLSFGTDRESLNDVEVVLTNHGPVVNGTVTDAQGRPATDYSIVAFSPDPSLWYQASRFMGFTRPKRDGTFSLSGLAPGEYNIIAVDSLQGAEAWGEWQDPEFLHSVELRAAKLTLNESQSAAVTLRIVNR